MSPIAVEARFTEALIASNDTLIRCQVSRAEHIDKLCNDFYQVEEQHCQLATACSRHEENSSWWDVAARISRWAGSCLSIAFGGLTGLLAASAVVLLDVASSTGLIERTAQAVESVIPGGYRAVQITAQLGSLAAGVVGALLGQVNIPGALKGVLVTGQAVSALGQGIEGFKLGNAQADLSACEAQLTTLQHRIRVEQAMFRAHEIEKQKQQMLAMDSIFVDQRRM